MTSAIVDVGHIITAHALATSDNNLPLWAAQVAYAAAPPAMNYLVSIGRGTVAIG